MSTSQQAGIQVKCKYHQENALKNVCTLITCTQPQFGCIECLLEDDSKNQHYNEHRAYIKSFKDFAQQITEGYKTSNTGQQYPDPKASKQTLKLMTEALKINVNKVFDALIQMVNTYRNQALSQLDKISENRVFNQLLPNLTKQDDVLKLLIQQDQDDFGVLKKEINKILCEGLRSTEEIKNELVKEYQMLSKEAEELAQMLIRKKEPYFSEELIFVPQIQKSNSGKVDVQFQSLPNRISSTKIPNTTFISPSKEWNTVLQQRDQNQLRLTSVSGSTTSNMNNNNNVSMNQSCNQIACYTYNGNIKFINSKNYEKCGKIDLDFKKSSSFQFSSGLGLIAIGNNQPPYEIAICSVRDQSVKGFLRGHQSQFIWHSFVFLDEYYKLVSGCFDKTIRIWNLNTFTEEVIIDSEGVQPYTFIQIPRSSYVACGGKGIYDIKLINVNEGKIDKTLRGHTQSIWALEWDSVNNLLISGSEDKSLRYWDIRNLQCLYVINTDDSISSLKFLPHKNLLLYTILSGDIVALNSTNNTIAFILKNHKSRVTDLDYDIDTQTLITSSADKSIIFWDLRNQQVKKKIEDLEHGIYGVRKI